MPKFARLALGGCALAGAVVAALLIGIGESPGRAAVHTAIPAGFAFVAALVQAHREFSGWLPSRRHQQFVTLLYSCMAGSLVTATASAMGFPLAVPSGVLVAGVASFRYYRMAAATPPSTRLPRTTTSLAETDVMIANCRTQLKNSTMSHAEQVNVKANLAEQLTSRAALTHSAGDLPEADQILTELTGDPRVRPEVRFQIATELCGTKSMLASMTGNTHGWQDALDRQLSLAESFPEGHFRQSALARSYDDQGQLHHFHLSRSSADDEPTSEWQIHRSAAIACWTIALGLIPEGSSLIPHLQMQVGALELFGDGGLEEVDAAIQRLRLAARLVRRAPLARNPNIPLQLAVGLTTRAQLLVYDSEQPGPDLLRRAEGDLAEADKLLRPIADSDLPLQGHAAQVLAQTHQIALLIQEVRADQEEAAAKTQGTATDRSVGGRGPSLDPKAAVAEAKRALARYRQAFEVMRRSTSTDATSTAHLWATFAAQLVDDGEEWAMAEAAEAFTQMVQQFPDELDRRSDPAELRRHANTMQGAAAEAGYWLARAGQVWEAARTVETARAVLLTARTRRLSPDLQQRLAAAGHEDLFAEYREAELRLDELERNEYERSSPAEPMAPAAGVALTPVQLAWSTFQLAQQRVAAVLPRFADDSDVDTDIFCLAGFATVVYLLAAERAGYALIIDDRGARSVELPGLTAASAQNAVITSQELTRPGANEDDPTYAGRWNELLTWLGAEALGPVMSDWSNKNVILIPLGALGSLPLHAAIIGTQLDGSLLYACDVADIRYGPNARMVADAIGRLTCQPPSNLVAIGVQEAPAGWNAQALQYAAREANQVCKQFRGQSVRLHSPTLESVSAHLGQADVWHFACHGITDATEPLDSALLMADQPLRLRHLMARPAGRHRLAILSACQSNLLDPGQLDEVISFPGGLMRAGVSGVIASQWAINDLAAFLLTQRFYELWPVISEPHVAFAQAQRWLREATWAELAPRITTDAGRRHRPDTKPRGAMTTRPFADKPWVWAAFSYTGA